MIYYYYYLYLYLYLYLNVLINQLLDHIEDVSEFDDINLNDIEKIFTSSQKLSAKYKKRKNNFFFI